jgi:hypothetical protein
MRRDSTRMSVGSRTRPDFYCNFLSLVSLPICGILTNLRDTKPMFSSRKPKFSGARIIAQFFYRVNENNSAVQCKTCNAIASTSSTRRLRLTEFRKEFRLWIVWLFAFATSLSALRKLRSGLLRTQKSWRGGIVLIIRSARVLAKANKIQVDRPPKYFLARRCRQWRCMLDCQYQ